MRLNSPVSHKADNNESSTTIINQFTAPAADRQENDTDVKEDAVSIDKFPDFDASLKYVMELLLADMSDKLKVKRRQQQCFLTNESNLESEISLATLQPELSILNENAIPYDNCVELLRELENQTAPEDSLVTLHAAKEDATCCGNSSPASKQAMQSGNSTEHTNRTKQPAAEQTAVQSDDCLATQLQVEANSSQRSTKRFANGVATPCQSQADLQQLNVAHPDKNLATLWYSRGMSMQFGNSPVTPLLSDSGLTDVNVIQPANSLATPSQSEIQLTPLNPQQSGNCLATPWQSEIDLPSENPKNATQPPSLTTLDPQKLSSCLEPPSGHDKFREMDVEDMESHCIEDEFNLTIEQLELLQEMLQEEDEHLNYMDWLTIGHANDFEINPTEDVTSPLWKCPLMNLIHKPNGNGERLKAGNRKETDNDFSIYMRNTPDDQDIDEPAAHKAKINRKRKSAKRTSKAKSLSKSSRSRHQHKSKRRDHELEIMRMPTRWPLHWPSPRVIQHMNKKKKKLVLRGMCSTRMPNLKLKSCTSRLKHPTHSNSLKKTYSRMHKPLLNQLPMTRSYSEFWYH